jgi:TolB-like protein/Flp pilus assembly protein TadD
VSTDKSIAVLPFENMSSDKDNAFFCDGVQEDILTNLANIAELRVVSRTSVEQYRATTKPIRQIAQELGVAWVLEGSVQRDGNKVRVTGQLIDAKIDEHVWAKAYDRDLSDIFAIQSELAETIASSLQAAISPQEKSVVERRPTQNLAAYDLFLKGNDMRNRNTRGTPAWLKEAEQYYAGAVDLDPNFAMAWAELAVVDAYYVFWDFDHTPARLAKADAAIERAVRLAPDDPGVISLLGDYAYHGYRDYARATEQFEKVIQLQPNNSAAIFNLGLVQRRQGRWIESIGNLRKGIELDPGNANYAGNFGSVLAAGRRWNEALAEQRRVVELLPDSLSEQALLAEMDFLASGSTKEADAWLARLTPAQFESPRIIYERKIWAIVKGNYLEWKRLDEAQPYFDEDDTPHWEEARDAALVLAAHGDLAGAKARLADFPTEVRSALQLEPANARLWSGLSVMEAIIGQKERALSDARKAVELIPDTLDAYEGPVFTANLAIVYAWTGDKDRAIDEFVRLVGAPGPASQRNLGMGGFNIYSMRYSAAFTPLHGDPRFEALVDDPKNNAPLF